MRKKLENKILFITVLIFSFLLIFSTSVKSTISTEYNIKIFNDMKYINETRIGEIVENIRGKFPNNSIILKNQANEILNSAETVKTGIKVEVLDELEEVIDTYLIATKGDVDGDGRILASDLSILKNHILEYEDYILKNECFIAGDIDNDEKILASDLSILKNYILGYEVEDIKKEEKTEKFIWDTTSYASNSLCLGGTLNYKVVSLDENNEIVENVKWEVTGGILDVADGLEVNWTLPNEEATYTITAISPSGKILTKTVDVLPIEQNKGIEETVEYNLEDDEDGDKLTNEEEFELGTDLLSVDSDMDGLTDYQEVKELETNPLKDDTDEDGILDGNEITLDLDPLKDDTDEDGILDGDEILSHSIENEADGIKINLTGKGNIGDLTAEKLKNTELSNINSVIGDPYQFHTAGNIENAEVTIKYDENLLDKKGTIEKDLSLYYFNIQEKIFEKVDTIIDEENDTATANLTHFSTYVLADSKTMVSILKNEIMFVIDNSGSMYTPEQAFEKSTNEDKKLEDFSTFQGWDSEYKRLNIVNQLVNRLSGKYKFGIGKFTAVYKQLSGLTDNKETLINATNSIKTSPESFSGTYIGESLSAALDAFNKDSVANKYAVLLTDGEDTGWWPSADANSAINKAKKLGVKVITIGLGNEVDTDLLQRIANQTGGKYFSASNANVLEQLYNTFYSELNFNLVDTDGDGKDDGVVIADSGFIPAVNGLSFDNYATPRGNGTCFGIANFSNLYYTNNLKLSSSKIYGEQELSYNLNNNFFNANSPFYEYKPQTESLLKLLTLSENELYDLDKLESDFESGATSLKLEFKGKYKKMIKESNGYIYTENHSKNFKKYGEVTKPYIYINPHADATNINKDDAQLLKALDYYFIEQREGVFNKVRINTQETFDNLINYIKNKNPVVLSLYVGDVVSEVNEFKRLVGKPSNHAINAINVIRDIENPNIYKIGVYDNNYSSEINYMSVTRNKLKYTMEQIVFGGEYSYSFKSHYGDKTPAYYRIRGGN